MGKRGQTSHLTRDKWTSYSGTKKKLFSNKLSDVTSHRHLTLMMSEDCE